MDAVNELCALIRARHTCISIVTYEEAHALSLVRRAVEDLGLQLQVWSAVRGLSGGGSERKAESTMNAAGALFAAARSTEQTVVAMLDLAAHLEDPTTLRSLRELIETFDRTSSSVVLIDHSDNLPAVIHSLATPFRVPLPSKDELGSILRRTVRQMNRDVSIKAKIDDGTHERLVSNLVGLTRDQAARVVRESLMDDFTLDEHDAPRFLASKRQLLQVDGLLEFVESLDSLDQVGGLEVLKRWLRQRQSAMSEDAASFGLQAPRGVLLLGVQGAGKSLCAKAIATAWDRPLLRLDPSVLYDRYIGESERRLRDALRQAEAMSPIVLWIDEIEKGFASAASHSVDGGLSQRMFGSLLTWMQEHTRPVFLVATANNIDALPPELLRKGRFDEIFFVDLPGAEARRAILEIHLSRRGRDAASLDLDQLVSVTEGYSGAEIEQAIVSALHEAYAEDLPFDTDLLARAISGSPPLSVTMRERVEQLRAWARDRCVFAG